MDKFQHKLQAIPRTAPILDYKYKQETHKKPTDIYCIPWPWHFGDWWCATNWFLRESEKTKQPTTVIYHRGVLEISKELHSNGSINFTEQPGNKEPKYGEYEVDYYPTKIRWKPTIKPHYRICYQLDGRSYENQKNPPPGDIEKLTTFIPDYKFTYIGLPYSVHDCINIAAQSDLFIGICSGMSHLVHSVGTPMFLIEYKYGLDRAHKRKKYTKCFGTDDCIEKVKESINAR